jgi:two-component system phosphate regulon response regulator PhoB
MGKDILIVEDEAPIREMVNFAISRAGFDLREAADARQAEVMIANRLPDLILLDWMLPGVSGIDLARRLRRDEATREVPIIVLTARGEEEDKVKGLEVGADDYVTKPFSPRELVARIRAVLRRASPEGDDERVEVGDLVLDTAGHRVLVNSQEVHLGPTEFRLLRFFMTHPDRVYSRGQLLDRVWGGNVYIEERTVDVHIRRLRMALEPFGYDRLLQTVRGSGYRFSV